MLQPAFTEKPKILDQGAFTKAAPVKESRNFVKVSDSIANNYSPGARKFTTSYLYQTTRGGQFSHTQGCKSWCYLLVCSFCSKTNKRTNWRRKKKSSYNFVEWMNEFSKLNATGSSNLSLMIPSQSPNYFFGQKLTWIVRERLLLHWYLILNPS